MDSNEHNSQNEAIGIGSTHAFASQWLQDMLSSMKQLRKSKNENVKSIHSSLVKKHRLRSLVTGVWHKSIESSVVSLQLQVLQNLFDTAEHIMRINSYYFCTMWTAFWKSQCKWWRWDTRLNSALSLIDDGYCGEKICSRPALEELGPNPWFCLGCYKTVEIEYKSL